MKKGIIFIILGIIGLAQYAYFQSTALAYVIDGVVKEGPVIVEVLHHRDWTLGIAGAIIGTILLILGIYWSRQARLNLAKQ